MKNMKKYQIIYADPPWSYYNDSTAKPDCTTNKGMRRPPYPDNVFKMVVFGPPHLTSCSMKSVINKKYGLLNKETWKTDIIAGFTECWRVLAPGRRTCYVRFRLNRYLATSQGRLEAQYG